MARAIGRVIFVFMVKLSAVSPSFFPILDAPNPGDNIMAGITFGGQTTFVSAVWIEIINGKI